VKRAALALGLICLMAAACSRANLDAITPVGTDGGPDTDGRADTAPPITCPMVALQPGNTTRTIQVAGMNRSYVLHVPSAYDGSKPVPLLLDFHGLTTSGSYEQMASAYPPVTDPDGAVMAFPSGLTGPAGAAWDVGPCCVANVDDVAFARAVVADVSAAACIDPKRVYAAGFSMGGGMAYYLACHAADVFAGVAPSSFDLLQDNVGECLPSRPITVISFRGSADNLVPYDGGPSMVVQGMPVTFLGAQATFQKWAEIDQCSGPPSAPDVSGCSTYSNCAGGVEVVLCTDQGGGQKQGNAAFAWPILKRHPLP
jgi:polyhydroxybutyrate depolymerase